MERETYLAPSQIAELVGMTVKRLELRRQRERIASDEGKEIEALPISQPEDGKHARYHFLDALTLSSIVELERAGYDFTKAIGFVKSARLSAFIAHDTSMGDFFVAGWTEADGLVHHAFGALSDVARRLPLDRIATTSLNVSSIARQLEAKLRVIGLERVGMRLVQREVML